MREKLQIVNKKGNDMRMDTHVSRLCFFFHRSHGADAGCAGVIE